MRSRRLRGKWCGKSGNRFCSNGASRAIRNCTSSQRKYCIIVSVPSTIPLSTSPSSFSTTDPKIPTFFLFSFLTHLQRIADIVFVHGLQGSFFSTWMVQQETSDFHHITCWPATYLPAYLANRDVSPPVRILSVSYHARMRKSSSPHPTLSIQEQAADLRKRLDSAGIGERPVIFVTHSLGGLIVKEMLVDESKCEKGFRVRL